MKMKGKFKDFIHDCYLLAEPSVDLDKVTTDNPVDCCKYTLRTVIYDYLVDHYCENEDDKYACNIWMLQSGPQLKED